MPNTGVTSKILIVDDSVINRAILADMLGGRFEILEAENGLQAIRLLQTYGTEISLMLLDVVMPEMDGFEVLALMNRYHWIEEIPVIMISAENSHSVVERAYELGAADYISRPFDQVIVRRRVINSIMLYTKQKSLVSMVADQMYESEKNNTLMVSILSHIVEFRNGESGLHVLHIGTMTEMLLKRLAQKSSRYNLTPSLISMIAKAAAFHDIGKIAISESILNKPDRLTPEEFAVIKTHSLLGAQMLENLPIHKNDQLVQLAYEICRWHHERYDGRGYPDGLKGDEIPISAQAVSLADAYDALISERVYKKAFSHETAMKMILEGQCGCFNPLLLECMQDISGRIQEELEISSLSVSSKKEIQSITQQLMTRKEIMASSRTLNLLEEERIKFQFFSAVSRELHFEYSLVPSMLTMPEWSAQQLDLPAFIVNPHRSVALLQRIQLEDLQKLDHLLRKAPVENPVVEYECPLNLRGVSRRYHFICRALWSKSDPPKYTGAIGKLFDVRTMDHDADELNRLASQDPLTGLPTLDHARQQAQQRLAQHPQKAFSLLLVDLDCFDETNRARGHHFGDRILKYLADCLRRAIDPQDISARAGGDEFLVFTDRPAHTAAQQILTALTGEYEGSGLSVSLGVATTSDAGREFAQLYHGADLALYHAKHSGKGRCCCYDPQLLCAETPSAVCPIQPSDAQF